MEKFSSNLLLRYSYTPRRKYVNNEEELTGEERKILNFSLFLLRAPLRLWKCSSTCCPCLSAWEGQNCFLGFKGLSSLLAVQLLSLSLVPLLSLYGWVSFAVSTRTAVEHQVGWMLFFHSSPLVSPLPTRVIRSLVSLFSCQTHIRLKFVGAIISAVIDVMIIISKVLFLVCFVKEMRHMQFLSICQSVGYLLSLVRKFSPVLWPDRPFPYGIKFNYF